MPTTFATHRTHRICRPFTHRSFRQPTTTLRTYPPSPATTPKGRSNIWFWNLGFGQIGMLIGAGAPAALLMFFTDEHTVYMLVGLGFASVHFLGMMAILKTIPEKQVPIELDSRTASSTLSHADRSPIQTPEVNAVAHVRPTPFVLGALRLGRNKVHTTAAITTATEHGEFSLRTPSHTLT